MDNFFGRVYGIQVDAGSKDFLFSVDGWTGRRVYGLTDRHVNRAIFSENGYFFWNVIQNTGRCWIQRFSDQGRWVDG